MSRFRDHAAVYGPDELAVFQEAFDHACRKLGLDPSPTDDTHYKRLRDDLATAIMNATRLGERDSLALSVPRAGVTGRRGRNLTTWYGYWAQVLARFSRTTPESWASIAHLVAVDCRKCLLP
jgi:hypothetical protein